MLSVYEQINPVPTNIGISLSHAYVEGALSATNDRSFTMRGTLRTFAIGKSGPSNRDRVLSFLQSISPADASNEEIVSRTGVKPHQQVFAITSDLRKKGAIKGVQAGKEWRFWVGDRAHNAVFAKPLPVLPTPPQIMSGILSPSAFEVLAQRVLSAHYSTKLVPGRISGVPKIFDLVSADSRIVGDAKFFTMVGGERLPPAKFSVIAEYVWLLEKADADRRFLVFGNDKRVPLEWWKRYGGLVRAVEFYFLDETGELTEIGADG
jgi:hypothetical protein